MSRPYRLSALALAFVFVLAGCVKQMIRQPVINLTDVKLGGIGLRGGQIIAELEIENPNSFDVETREITYDLKISDRDATGKETWIDFAKGTYNRKIEVDDGGKTRVEIPIDFTYASAGGAIRSIMDRGTFNYKVEGTVALREPLSRVVNYSKTGNISLQGVR